MVSQRNFVISSPGDDLADFSERAALRDSYDSERQLHAIEVA
jgi:hypothetical protein